MIGAMYTSHGIDYQDWFNLKKAGVAAPVELKQLTGIVLNAQALSLRFNSVPVALKNFLPAMRYECWVLETNALWHVFVSGFAAIHAERDAINLRQKQERHNYWGRFALTRVLPADTAAQWPRPWLIATATEVADCGSATTPWDPARVLGITHHR